jgi:MFS family permease
MGLAFSGAGLGGLLFPFIFSTSLRSLGLPWTLRIWAGILVLGAGPALVGIKPRLPVVRRGREQREERRGRGRSVWNGMGYLFSWLWLTNVSPFHGTSAGDEKCAGTDTRERLQAMLTLTASAGYFAISFYLNTYCTNLGLSSAGEWLTHGRPMDSGQGRLMGGCYGS